MISEREMARIVERGQQQATETIAGIWEPIADGGAGYENAGSYMNRACGIGVDGPVSGEDLDRLVAFFLSHGAEPRVEVSAYADPSLLQGLAARRFVLRHLEHVFARELSPDDDFELALPKDTLRGVVIESVDREDEATMRAYVDMAASGFLPEGAEISDANRASGIKGARLATSDSFVARVDGRVVGAAGSGTRLGMTTLFGATVAKDFRRRGIQQALIAARLAGARDRGATFANIRAVPGIATERNAVRLGFRLITSRVVLVLPANAPTP
jgi:GNAT superfamily N-acetyltransferase